MGDNGWSRQFGKVWKVICNDTGKVRDVLLEVTHNCRERRGRGKVPELMECLRNLSVSGEERADEYLLCSAVWHKGEEKGRKKENKLLWVMNQSSDVV